MTNIWTGSNLVQFGIYPYQSRSYRQVCRLRAILGFPC